MSGTDYRALCAELLDEVAARPLILDRELIARARAALAEPVAEGPTDEEIMSLMPQQMHKDLAAAVRAMAEQEGIDSTLAKGVMRITLNRHCVDLARAVLARYGHQPAPPAEGEVAELVAALRSQAIDCTCDHLTSGDLRRAADLLERQAAPVLEPALARINDILNDSGRILQTDELEALELARQALEQRQAAPVPVAERLPGPEDCDAEGRCWVYELHEACPECPSWELRRAKFASANYGAVCWLPAHALPLPSGEVE